MPAAHQRLGTEKRPASRGPRPSVQTHPACSSTGFDCTGNGNSHWGRCGHTSGGCLPGSQKKKRGGEEREKGGIVESLPRPPPPRRAPASSPPGPPPSRPAAPRRPSPRTPRPPGAARPRGPQVRTPPPPRPPLGAGASLGTFSARGAGDGETWGGRPAVQAHGGRHLRRRPEAPEPRSPRAGPRSGGGAGKPRRGDNGRAHGRAALSSLIGWAGTVGAGVCRLWALWAPCA